VQERATLASLFSLHQETVSEDRDAWHPLRAEYTSCTLPRDDAIDAEEWPSTRHQPTSSRATEEE
jgi:hypothetical protein